MFRSFISGIVTHAFKINTSENDNVNKRLLSKVSKSNSHTIHEATEMFPSFQSQANDFKNDDRK